MRPRELDESIDLLTASWVMVYDAREISDITPIERESSERRIQNRDMTCTEMVKKLSWL